MPKSKHLNYLQKDRMIKKYTQLLLYHQMRAIRTVDDTHKLCTFPSLIKYCYHRQL